jgi:lipopolysaccharide/colanic/teichoic acid biosynthesis glycosyltransferase
MKTISIFEVFQKNHKSSKLGYERRETRGDLIDLQSGLYQEVYFCELLSIERKRSERSRNPFLLMLCDLQGFEESFDRHTIAKKVKNIFSSVTRDTDIKGWYKYDSQIGIVFTEVAQKEKNLTTALKYIEDKCIGALEYALDEEDFKRVTLNWYVFPGQFDKVFTSESPRTKVYPDALARIERKSGALFVKRLIDIFGSIVALTFTSPLLLFIAVLIKFTSKGPVLFKQERVGLLGKRFLFFKFRSMYTDNDATIHREFVKDLINGKQKKARRDERRGQKSVYKIKRDPRVTPFGYILRMTSLDELPQLWNVLRGEMSLVGPRPPIPYECEDYDVWHRRRVVEMKPGITGLWQVKGRSTATFDEMVRMDIQYTRDWSLWLDIKILLQTPWAVITAKGAY